MSPDLKAMQENCLFKQWYIKAFKRMLPSMQNDPKLRSLFEDLHKIRNANFWLFIYEKHPRCHGNVFQEFKKFLETSGIHSENNIPDLGISSVETLLEQDPNKVKKHIDSYLQNSV